MMAESASRMLRKPQVVMAAYGPDRALCRRAKLAGEFCLCSLSKAAAVWCPHRSPDGTGRFRARTSSAYVAPVHQRGQPCAVMGTGPESFGVHTPSRLGSSGGRNWPRLDRSVLTQDLAGTRTGQFIVLKNHLAITHGGPVTSGTLHKPR